MSHELVSAVTDPGPSGEGKSRPQRLNKAGSEGLITFVLSGPVWKQFPAGKQNPNSGLRKHRQEEDLTTLLYPTSLPAYGFAHSGLAQAWRGMAGSSRHCGGFESATLRAGATTPGIDRLGTYSFQALNF
jgi:hypothetical protein